MKVFYTFGSDEKYPHYGGWVEVEAASMEEAHETFRAHYPDRLPGILNCAFYYIEDEFNATNMPAAGNWGAFCHRKLKATGR